jgi:hypothetical protein
MIGFLFLKKECETTPKWNKYEESYIKFKAKNRDKKIDQILND